MATSSRERSIEEHSSFEEWFQGLPGDVSPSPYSCAAYLKFREDIDPAQYATFVSGPFVSRSVYVFQSWFLHACQLGHVDMVDCFLAEKRFEPRFCNYKCCRNAALSGQKAVLDLLFQDERFRNTAAQIFSLEAAAERGRLELVNHLLEFPLVGIQVDRVLRVAAIHGQVSIVHCLLNIREENRISAHGITNALCSACRSGRAHVVKILLKDARCDPNSMLHHELRTVDADMLQLLIIDGRYDTSKERNHAIRDALVRGKLDCLDCLLADGRVNPSSVHTEIDYPVDHRMVPSVDDSYDGLAEHDGVSAIEFAEFFDHTGPSIRLILQDPRTYQHGFFLSVTSPTVRQVAFNIFTSDDMKFDITQLLSREEIDGQHDLRAALEHGHKKALDRAMPLLQSICLQSFPEAVQVLILDYNCGNLLFPLFPREQRWRRIATLVELVNRRMLASPEPEQS